MGKLKNLWTRLRAHRQPRRNGYGPDVLCAGWVDLPAALRAPRATTPPGRTPADG